MLFRLRKLIGAVLLLLLIPIYVFAGILVASMIPVTTPMWIQMLFYLVAGLGWVLPSGLIISLMFRPPAAT